MVDKDMEQAILSLRKDGLVYTRIAEITNVHKAEIWRICKRNGLCNGNYFSKEGIEARNRSIVRRKSEKAKQETYVCQYCNKTYIRNFKRHGDEGKRFCSRECAFADKAKNKKEKVLACKVYFLACIMCGQMFTARNGNKKYCSSECMATKHKLDQVKKYQEIIRKYKIKKHEEKNIRVICKECGREFVPEYGHNRRIYCCEFCEKRHSKRTGHHKRRARKRNSKYENINPFVIFDRDNWTCQLCGVKTPKRLRGSIKRRAPELDHIIPLAAGGGHVKENLQCACRECNIEKGAIPLGQMRLF